MTSVRVAEILSAVWADSPDGSGLPTGLVHACAGALPISGVGLALMTEQGPAGTVAATDGAALELEELQFTLGEGPCVDASKTGRPVLQPDLASTAPGRWPAFASGALAAGVAAVFALPLRVGAIRVGVLDLYRASPGTLGPAELTEALSYADAATLLLLYLQTRASESEPLHALAVLDDRAEVHQATGVLSVQAGIGLAEAFVLLRARAYAENRPLGEVARDVMTGSLDLSDDRDDRDDRDDHS
ncbi:GAF and ANTAR domain-containing protein [Blastococcus sp. CT_GayMR16]|uniref:GAF and ANTAR domain-containing protein n=1 Tax=Blastococcus sp. CT_GayMR16 TaxID=2559607 RepID=UPI001074298A|nr:GAF and ANTAR domain-containing protein [Blastococcus sp. CT_GayMR16]TFV88906.1 ANTAR domain-containing protein [Blastococcus sp. CT_GayMR16]